MNQATTDWIAKWAPAWTRWALYLQFAASAFSIAATELAHAMLLLGFVAYRSVRPTRVRLPAWIVAPFVVLLAVAVLSALHNSESLTRLRWIGQDYRLFIVPFLVLFALQWVDDRRLMRVLLFFFAAVSIYGIVQYFYGAYVIPDDQLRHFDVIDGRVRVKANQSTPLTYSGILLIVAPLFISLAFSDKGPSRERWRWLSGGLLAIAGVLVSLTRSSVIGLVVALLVLGARFNRRLTLLVTGLACLVGVAATAALVLGVTVPKDDIPRLPVVLQRFAKIDLRDHGILTRVYLWESALLGFRDRPLLGFGMNSHDPDVIPYQRAVGFLHGGFNFEMHYGAPSHNVYLEVLFELGIIGLLVYLWLWGSMLAWNAVWLARSKGSGFLWERAVLWGASAGLVGSMIAGIFEDNIFDAEVQTVVTLVMGLSLHAGLRIRERHAGPAAPAGLAPERERTVARAVAGHEPAGLKPSHTITESPNMITSADTPVDYTQVTEIAGDEVSREQVERIAHRYCWAGSYCEGRDVIEAACGSGQGLGYLARKARSLTAGDISTELLERARAHYGDRVKVEPFDAQELPFPDASADVVILFEAIYYLPSADRFLEECRRVLRDGGHVLLTTANKDLYDFNPSMYSQRYYGVVELKELLARHGFTSALYGYLPLDRVSLRQRILRPVKKLAVALRLMPKTMAGKKLLKRLVFGSLVPMPAEITEDMVSYQIPVALNDSEPDGHHKVLYCAATKTQR